MRGRLRPAPGGNIQRAHRILSPFIVPNLRCHIAHYGVMDKTGLKSAYHKVLTLASVGLLAFFAFRLLWPPPLPVSPPLSPTLDADRRLTFHLPVWDLHQAVGAYSELTGRDFTPQPGRGWQRLDRVSGGRLTSWGILPPKPVSDSGLRIHGDGPLSALELKAALEQAFKTNHLRPETVGSREWRLVRISN